MRIARALGAAACLGSTIALAPAAPAKESSVPIRIVAEPPAAIAGAAAAPISRATLPASVAGSPPVGNLGPRAFFSPAGGVEAVDLETGARLWQAPHTLANEGVRSFGSDLIFVKDVPNYLDMTALSVRDGTVRRRIADAAPGNVVDGYMYSTYHDYFTAMDASSGRPVWTGYGAGSGPAGATWILGNLLLSDAVDDGAVTMRLLDAYDVRTGRALWSHASASEPLGYGTGTVYLDATWFPSQLENYVALTVDTVALANGKTLHSYSYAPDPDANASSYLNGKEVLAQVSGGYVYVRVNGTWYRYVADRAPANPVRLEGIDPKAWFGGGRMLVAAAAGAAIARSFPDRIELQPLGEGPLRSGVFLRSDGTRYAVAGDTLLAFDAGGTPRAAGSVACEKISSMLFWQRRVAVLCDDSGSVRSLVFADAPAPAEPSHPHPQAPAAKSHFFRVHAFPIPPNDSGPGGGQWYVHGLAPLPNGAMAFPLQPDGNDRPGAIGIVSPAGAIRLVRLGSGPPAVYPDDVATDAAGNVYYSDLNRQTATKLAPSGMTTVVVSASPPPQLDPRPGLALARAADGSMWFARNLPRVQIGRIDGSRIYDVPASYGAVLSLKPGTDGALSFVTRTRLARMTPGGRFAGVPLPREIAAFSGYPERVLTAGKGGTMWVAAGAAIARIDLRGGARTFRLPGDAASVAAMVQGCDGALYVFENTPQVARIAPDGTLEEFPLDVTLLDGAALASNCKIWFTAGSNLPSQQVGTLEFLAKRPGTPSSRKLSRRILRRIIEPAGTKPAERSHSS